MLKTARKIKKLAGIGKLILLLAAVVGVVLLCVSLWEDSPSHPKLTPSDPAPQALQPYKPTDFVQDKNGFMACLSREYQTGIDVSEYQSDIDWDRVKAAGIDFVFIRLGSRGTTEGGLYTDTMTQAHYDGAKRAGLQVGMYFFAQAITLEEAQEEAAFVLEHMGDYHLDLPFVYDWEWGGEGSRTTGMDKETLTQITRVFCRDIAAGGLSPMIYFNESQGLEQLDLEQLAEYPFWLALYDGNMDFPYAVDCWQYTDTGKVDGIDGKVDLNILLLN